MRKNRFGFRSLLVVVTICAFFVPPALHVFQWTRSVNGCYVHTRTTINPSIESRYRVAIMFDHLAEQPVIVAIEKASHNVERRLPSFCALERWHPGGRRSVASFEGLKVMGRLIVPTNRVQVFSSECGQTPRKLLMTREQYVAIAGRGILPKSDDELWNAVRFETSSFETQ